MQMIRWIAAAILIVLTSQNALVFGQHYTDEVPSKASWVVPYALVVLSVGVGVYIISKPARREK